MGAKRRVKKRSLKGKKNSPNLAPEGVLKGLKKKGGIRSYKNFPQSF